MKKRFIDYLEYVNKSDIGRKYFIKENNKTLQGVVIKIEGSKYIVKWSDGKISYENNIDYKNASKRHLKNDD